MTTELSGIKYYLCNIMEWEQMALRENTYLGLNGE